MVPKEYDKGFYNGYRLWGRSESWPIFGPESAKAIGGTQRRASPVLVSTLEIAAGV